MDEMFGTSESQPEVSYNEEKEDWVYDYTQDFEISGLKRRGFIE
jgi:hypothetical protein